MYEYLYHSKKGRNTYMKKWMRKLCGVSLALAVACSMMITLPVFAEGEGESIISVAGVPKDAIMAGSKLDLIFSIDSEEVEDYTDLYLVISGPFTSTEGTTDEDGYITINLKNTNPVTVPVKINADAYPGESGGEVDLYGTHVDSETGALGESGIIGWNFFDLTIQQIFSIELTQWNPINEAVAGTPYPFAVTVTNNTDSPLKDITVTAGGLNFFTELYHWKAIIDYEAMEGVTIDSPDAVIQSLAPKASVTIKGTITFPAESIGDDTHLYIDVSCNDFEDYLNGYGNLTDSYHFPIVASPSSGNQGGQGNGSQGFAGQNTNGQNTGTSTAVVDNVANTANASSVVKTGDPAETAAPLAALLIAASAIVIDLRKRRTV